MALVVKDLIDWLETRTEKTTLPEGVVEDLSAVASDLDMSEEARGLLRSLVRDYAKLSGELEDQLTYSEGLADVDPMLQIANRKKIMSIIETEWAGSKRYHNPSSILLFRLDQDLLEEDGQPVLLELSRLIKTRTRMTDTLGRIDRDRFALVVPTTNNVQAAWLGDKLRESVEEEIKVDGQTITCSFGVADSDASMSPEDWLRIAGDALEEAYQQGGNQVIDFEHIAKK